MRMHRMLLVTFLFVCILLECTESAKGKRRRKNRRLDLSQNLNNGSVPFDLSRHLQQIKYVRSNPPHSKNGEATKVELGIYINNIYSISELSEDYSLNIYLRQRWRDPRLTFQNPVPNSNTTYMIKLEDNAWDKVWVPDVFFRNEKKATFHHMTTPNRLMRLYSDGTVWYASKITVTLSCPMSLQKYPLDIQKCPMLFESFGYTTEVLYFEWLPPPKIPVVAPEEVRRLPEFYLENWGLENCTKTYTTGSYPCLKVVFTFDRATGYYIIQVYIPSAMIVVLSWVSYWINIDATPARVSLGLLSVLTMTTQSASARSSLPRVSYIKAIDVWMSVCLLFVFTSLLESAVVNVHARKLTVKSFASRMPQLRLWRKKKDINTPTEEIKVNIEPNGNKSEERNQQTELTCDSDGRKKARMVDKFSRKFFPITFIVFNAAYWAFYTQIPIEYLKD